MTEAVQRPPGAPASTLPQPKGPNRGHTGAISPWLDPRLVSPGGPRREATGIVPRHRSDPGVDFVLVAGKARIGADLDTDPEPVLQRIDEIAGLFI